jgi:hypothetical protein
MTTLRQHTLASIAADADTTKRTVQRWLTKSGDIGELVEDTRYFSDAERDQLLSHQSKHQLKQEVIEAELIEPGAIELHHSVGSAAAPLMRFDLKPIQIDLPTLDVSALTAQTEQLEQSAQQGANALAAYFGARFDVGLAKIAAAQDNLLKGIEAQALNGAARSISNQQATPGKPR